MRTDYFSIELLHLEMKTPSLIISFVFFAFAKDVWCSEHDGFYKSGNDDEQIVGGYNDTIQNNPYIVYLLLVDAKNHVYQCGGSIISEYYILTAAHCTKGIVLAVIRAGSSEANSGGETYGSGELIHHPSYNSKNFDFDVAVIRTTKPIRLDGINTKAAKLPKQDYDVKPGTNIKLSGWGRTEEDGKISPNLLSVVIQTLSNDSCSQQLGYSITESQLCAGVPEGGKGPCQGDSGGPAVVSQTKEVVGIVSNGIGCARPRSPAVFTKVSCAGVRSWIKRTTGV